MDTIISQKLLHSKQQTNQFSYYLGKDQGFLSFGTTDTTLPISYASILPQQNYWTVLLFDVRKEWEGEEGK